MFKGSPREIKVHCYEQTGLSGSRHVIGERERKYTDVWRLQGNGRTVDTNCLIREAEITWSSPWMPRPGGPKLWGLCSLGWGVGHVHICGSVTWADMENYKEHAGALADTIDRTAKCPPWEQLNITEWPGKLQGWERCLLLGKWDKVSKSAGRPLTPETIFCWAW